MTGWFAVDAVSYRGGEMTSLDRRFEQLCDGETSGLYGQRHWRAGDPAPVVNPVNPPPANLWRPPANLLPASGNYAYLASDPGDYVGRSSTVLSTASNAAFVLGRSPARGLMIDTGDNRADFVGMQAFSPATS